MAAPTTDGRPVREKRNDNKCSVWYIPQRNETDVTYIEVQSMGSVAKHRVW